MEILDVLVVTNQAGQSVYALFIKEPPGVPLLTPLGTPGVPLLTPLGTAALIGLLSVIATSTLVRRKRR